MSHANNRSFREASASQNALTNIAHKKTRKVTHLLPPQSKADQRREDSYLLNKNRQNNS